MRAWRDQLGAALLSVYAMGVLLAAFQLIAWRILDIEPNQGDGLVRLRPPGSFGNTNAMALMMVLAIALTLARGGSGQTICLVVYHLGLALTLSLAGILTLGAFYLVRLDGRGELRRWLPGLACAVASGLLLFLWIRPAGATIGGLWNRLGIYTVSVKLIQLHPWMGWGRLGVEHAFGAYRDSFPFTNSLVHTHAHDLYLQIAILVGLPVALLFTGCLTFYVWVTRSWPILSATLSALMVNGLFDYHFYNPIILSLTVITIGVIHALQAGQYTTRPSMAGRDGRTQRCSAGILAAGKPQRPL